jgi:predicted dehydrogenase
MSPRPCGLPLRTAVVGCGAISEFQHLPALAAVEGIEIAALVDLDQRRARRLAEAHGVETVAGAVDGLSGIADAAIVAVPNALHAGLTVELLAQGLHVLVEKPMAVRAEQCDAMIEAAQRAGRVLAVGLEFRCFPASRWVERTLQGGLLGELRSFEVRQGVDLAWPFASDFVLHGEHAGGGVLLDFGAHVLDLLLWWLGDLKPLAYRDDARGGVEANCEIELETAAGVPGTVELSRTRNLPNTCRIEGERGSLEVDIWDPDPCVRLAVSGGGRLRGRVAETGDGGFDFAAAFRRQLEAFVTAVRGGGEPTATGREARRAIALIDSCYALREPLTLPWLQAPAAAAAGI